MSEITETHAASGPAAVSAAGTSAGPGAAGWAELPSAEQRRAALSSGTVPRLPDGAWIRRAARRCISVCFSMVPAIT